MMATNIRTIITETIHLLMDEGIPEAEAKRTCEVRLLQMQASLQEDFFRQFTGIVVNAVWSDEVGKIRQVIRRNIAGKYTEGQPDGGHYLIDAHVNDAPTPGQEMREEYRKRTREAQLDILDLPMYVPGIGRVPLREATIKNLNACAMYHGRMMAIHAKPRAFCLAVVEAAGRATDANEDARILEYITKDTVESLYNEAGRPAMVDDADGLPE